LIQTYRYRLYPNQQQEEMIRRHIGACRFIHNWALEQRINAYKDEKKSLSWYDTNNMLTELKRTQCPWLYDISSPSLQFANKRVDLAFQHFFRRVKNGNEELGYPKFKSKHNSVQSYDVRSDCYKVDFQRKQVRLPKIGWVRTVLHREFDGTPKMATVKMTKTGKFFITIPVEDGKKPPERAPVNENNTVGIDVGLLSYATLSTGEKIPNPRHLDNSLKRLKALSRRLSRKKKGSKNREKARANLARLYERINNQRSDFLHKLSTRLIHENQGIAVESLDIKGMTSDSRFARGISDASWGTFILMLDYKCQWNGKTLLRIGRFEPSSKLCNVCGYKNDELELSQRQWKCPDCGAVLDRDVNAALNIKRLGLITPQGLGEEPVDQLALASGMKQETGIAQ